MSAFGLLRAPREVLFGQGTLEAVGWAAARFGRRALLCVDPSLPAAMRESVMASVTRSGVEATLFSEVPGASTPELVERAAAVTKGFAADVIVAVGGGTYLDLGKLAALRGAWPGPISRYYGERRVPGVCLPLISAPTTAGTGSEISPVAIVSDPAHPLKQVVSDPWLIPTVAVCDPAATLSCPAAITAQAGIDALVNAIESYTSAERAHSADSLTEPVFVGNGALTRGLALKAVALIAQGLPRAVEDGTDMEARELQGLGSLKAALAFSQTGTGAVHALDYPVEGHAHIPHGVGVGLLLPYVLAFNLIGHEADHAALARAAGACSATDTDATAAASLVPWVVRLNQSIGIPATLAEVGVDPGDLPRLADQAFEVKRLVLNNARPVDRAALLGILEAAWAGWPA